MNIFKILSFIVDIQVKIQPQLFCNKSQITFTLINTIKPR